MQPAYPVGMGESIRKQRRRKKLKALLDEVGGPAQAERDTGTPKTHFSAMAAGTRGLGDQLAAKLESAYGKPPGWFDADQNAYWPFTDELQQKVAILSDEELTKAENVLRAHLGMRQKVVSVFTNNTQIADEEPGHGRHSRDTEEGAGPLAEAEVPAPNKHARKTDRRPARQKGSGGH